MILRASSAKPFERDDLLFVGSDGRRLAYHRGEARSIYVFDIQLREWRQFRYDGCIP